MEGNSPEKGIHRGGGGIIWVGIHRGGEISMKENSPGGNFCETGRNPSGGNLHGGESSAYLTIG